MNVLLKRSWQVYTLPKKNSILGSLGKFSEEQCNFVKNRGIKEFVYLQSNKKKENRLQWPK